MSRARTLLVLTALVTGAFAGCLQTATEAPDAQSTPRDPIPADWWVNSIPWGDGHDHGNHAHHQNLSTRNFHVLGYDPLVTDSLGTTATGMGCGGTGTRADGQRLAVVHTISTDVAFIVADITDPAAPKKLGEYFIPNVVVWDATVTPDGMHVLVGAYPWVFGGPTNIRLPATRDEALAKAYELEQDPAVKAAKPATFKVQPKWRDACTGEVRNAGPEQYFLSGPALIMVGLQDPSQPKLEQWVPQPFIGPHSVSTTSIDNVTYAMSSVTNLVHAASYYHFFRVTAGPTGSILQHESVLQAPGVTSPSRLNGHIDVEMEKHPITGKPVAYLANWHEGLTLYDMSDMRAPKALGTWRDGSAGSIHEALPLQVTWEGRHYTFAGQEVGEPVDLPSGWVYILDTTDPANIVEVGRWTLPVKPDWDGGLQFSTHYVEIVNHTLFVANYHGGLWAVSLENLSDPRAVGLFVPDRPSPNPAKNAGGPTIGDVLAGPDGVLTVWDNSGGIYQLRFDESDPAPPAPAWKGE